MTTSAKWKITRTVEIPTEQDDVAKRIENLKLCLVLPRHFPLYGTPSDEQIIEQCWWQRYPWEL